MGQKNLLLLYEVESPSLARLSLSPVAILTMLALAQRRVGSASEFACTLYKRIITRLRLFNLLKPTGYVMHQQFNIQQLYALPTLYLCVLYLTENKQRLVPLTA